MSKTEKAAKAAPTNLYHIHLTFNEPMLGTAPANPEVYADFIVAKKFAEAKDLQKKGKLTDEEAKVATDAQEALTKEELAMLPEDVDKGTTVFRRHPETKQLILLDHMVRGFLKEAGTAIGLAKDDGEITNWGMAQKIDRWVFCTDGKPRPGLPGGVPTKIIPILRGGKPIMAPEPIHEAPSGTFQRPLRAQTMQGQRTTLACSEVIAAGAELDFFLYVFPLGQDKARITKEVVESWLNYGYFVGLGQWRSGGMGRFTPLVEPVL